jgi:hypothetical protein
MLIVVTNLKFVKKPSNNFLILSLAKLIEFNQKIFKGFIEIVIEERLEK